MFRTVGPSSTVLSLHTGILESQENLVSPPKKEVLQRYKIGEPFSTQGQREQAELNGLVIRVQKVLVSRAQGVGVSGLGFRVQGLGFRGLEFRV